MLYETRSGTNLLPVALEGCICGLYVGALRSGKEPSPGRPPNVCDDVHPVHVRGRVRDEGIHVVPIHASSAGR
jgi:hypothetical protein